MKSFISNKSLRGVVATIAIALTQRAQVEAQSLTPHSFLATAAAFADGNLPEEPTSPIETRDSLPDAPTPQVQVVGQNQQPAEHDQTHINPIPLLSPGLVTGTKLSAHDKWEIYYHKAYSPAALVFPLVGSGFQMENPKKEYPKEWKDGMGAFGRIYGNTIAQRTARSTADFGTQVLMHEDPRYQRSESTNPIARVGHALAWTFVDNSDSGHRTFALSTFTSSAAGGFVGMAYLPDGYNDATHAEQRMVMGIGGRAIGNVVTEFEPVWGPWAAKLHIPKLLPAWWIQESKH